MFFILQMSVVCDRLEVIRKDTKWKKTSVASFASPQRTALVMRELATKASCNTHPEMGSTRFPQGVDNYCKIPTKNLPKVCKEMG